MEFSTKPHINYAAVNHSIEEGCPKQQPSQAGVFVYSLLLVGPPGGGKPMTGPAAGRAAAATGGGAGAGDRGGGQPQCLERADDVAWEIEGIDHWDQDIKRLSKQDRARFEAEAEQKLHLQRVIAEALVEAESKLTQRVLAVVGHANADRSQHRQA